VLPRFASAGQLGSSSRPRFFVPAQRASAHRGWIFGRNLSRRSPLSNHTSPVCQSSVEEHPAIVPKNRLPIWRQPRASRIMAPPGERERPRRERTDAEREEGFSARRPRLSRDFCATSSRPLGTLPASQRVWRSARCCPLGMGREAAMCPEGF